MADGLKLNLKEAILLKNAEGTWWEIKGNDSSGASFSWESPIAFTVDAALGQSITISNVPSSTIDWGDGTSVTTTGGATISHTYSSPTGTYDVVVYSKGFRQIAVVSDNVIAVKSYYGGGVSPLSRFGSSNLLSVTRYLPPNTTSISGIFLKDLNSLIGSENLNDPNISSWDTSNVTLMSTVFAGCTAFNQPLDSWDVSRVVSMNGMFRNASSFNQNIGSWDVSSVTSMSGLFQNAIAFNQDISSWDISRVTNMSNMFFDAIAFNQDISSWDVSRVTNMGGMFVNAEAFNQDISSWDVSRVTNMSNMFRDAIAFNQDISSWDTSNVTNMSSMFFQASSFNQDLGSLPINNVINMNSMFRQGISTENYSRTLIGWANQHFAGNAQNNVPLGAPNRTYNNTAYTTGNQFNDAVSARAYLVNTAGWTITDGGQV